MIFIKCLDCRNRLFVFCFLLICISTALVGCESSNNLQVVAEEKYETEVKPELLEMLRNATNLEDLDIEPEFRYDLATNSETKKQEVNLECYITFKSDKIDEYFTTEYNKESSFKLAKLLNAINDNINGNDDLIYTYDVEDKVINITFTTGSAIKVNTSSGRLYQLTNGYDDMDKIEIDDEWVYYKKHGDYSTTSKNNTSSSSSSNKNSGYTGSYDATLKYEGTKGVLVCISEDAMDRFMTALARENEGTIEELFLTGQCGYTEQGTKCNIVERKFSKAKVKLLDGSYAGNTVWVVIESVQEK